MIDDNQPAPGQTTPEATPADDVSNDIQQVADEVNQKPTENPDGDKATEPTDDVEKQESATSEVAVKFLDNDSLVKNYPQLDGVFETPEMAESFAKAGLDKWVGIATATSDKEKWGMALEMFDMLGITPLLNANIPNLTDKVKNADVIAGIRDELKNNMTQENSIAQARKNWNDGIKQMEATKDFPVLSSANRKDVIILMQDYIRALPAESRKDLSLAMKRAYNFALTENPSLKTLHDSKIIKNKKPVATTKTQTKGAPEVKEQGAYDAWYAEFKRKQKEE